MDTQLLLKLFQTCHLLSKVLVAESIIESLSTESLKMILQLNEFG